MNIKRILLSAVLSAGMLISSAGCSGKSGNSGNIGDITFADGDKIAVIEIKDYGTMKAKLFPDIAPVGVENFIKLTESGYYNGLKIHRVVKDNVIQGGSLYGDGTGGSAAYTGDDSTASDSSSAATTFPIEVNENARNFYGALGYVADQYGQNAVQFYIINNKEPQNILDTDASKVQSEADALASEAAEATWEASSSKAKVNSYQQSYYSNNAKMLTSKNNAGLKYAQVGGIYAYDGAYTVFGQVYEGLDVLDKISEVNVTTNAQGEKSMPIEDIVICSVTIETYTTSTAEAENESGSKTSKPSAQQNSAAQPTKDSTAESTGTGEAGTTAPSAESTRTAEVTPQTAESSISTIDTTEA